MRAARTTAATPLAAVLLVGLLALTACSGPGDPGDAATPPTSPAAGTGAPDDVAGDGADTHVETPTPTAAPGRRPTAPPVEPPAPAETPSRDPLADLVEQVEVVEEPVLGADVSWPQCPPGLGIPQKRTLGMPMPVPEARYVVVGLTNGPGFTPNPCLADQVAWVRERRLMIGAYAVASYPSEAELGEHGADGPFDGTDRLGALANTGYQQAVYNVASMKAAGLLTPVVWVDVEPVPDFEWSGDPEANAAVVSGTVRGYEDAGYAVGVYSTPALWDGVVGDLALGVPEWRAAGHTSRAEALDRCGEDWSIQGGQAVMGQWVERDRDMNVTCPGVTDLAGWFHQF